MNVFIVQGSVALRAGAILVVCGDMIRANAEALAIVNTIREEFVYDEEDASYSRQLPPLQPGDDWRAGLREWQRAKIEGDTDIETAESLSDIELVDTTGCEVWVTEREVLTSSPPHIAMSPEGMTAADLLAANIAITRPPSLLDHALRRGWKAPPAEGDK